MRVSVKVNGHELWVFDVLNELVMRRGRYGEAAARVVHGVRLRFGFDKAENNRESWVRV
jgi:hypothetical protein